MYTYNKITECPKCSGKVYTYKTKTQNKRVSKYYYKCFACHQAFFPKRIKNKSNTVTHNKLK